MAAKPTASVDGDDASEDACAPVKDSDVRIMFAERQGASLPEVLSDGKDRRQNATALIGPEGGWADDEIDQAAVAGWKIVTTGRAHPAR